nr:hypothetical protein pM02_c6_26 [uncultured bacterium]
MNMTQHANVRSQQRAIPPILIDLLLKFGSSEPAGNGAEKLFFDKAARRQLKAYAGPLAGLLSEHLNVYVVVGQDDQVITIAHLTDRIRRH